MTAPVTQTLVPPVKQKTTVPVTQAAMCSRFLMQFVMPKSYTVARLPEPLDARLQPGEVPANRLAVNRFSGSWPQSTYDE